MFTPALVDRAFTVIYDVGSRIGFLKKLVILFGQAGNTLPADRGQYPGTPAAFNVPLVAGARGLYHCGIPLLI